MQICKQCGTKIFMHRSRTSLCRLCQFSRQTKKRVNKRHDEPQGLQAYLRELKYKHGLSTLDYAKIVIAQKYCCALCGADLRTKRRALDHDHKTRRVRELLCWQCNLFVGVIEKNIVLAEKIILYLRKHEQKTA